jgi:hypothetical protein
VAKFGSNKAELCLVGGYDVIGVTTQFTTKNGANSVDSTPLGSAWTRKDWVGTREVGFTQQGFYDDATASIVDMIAAKFIASVDSTPAVLGVEGNTLGQRFIGYRNAVIANVSREASRDNITSLSFEVENEDATYGEIDGTIIQPWGAVSGTSNGSGHNNTAASSNGAIIIAHLGAITGTPTSFTFKLQDSADGGVYADLQTVFNAVNTPYQAVALIKTGAIRQYLRASWSWVGGTAPTAQVFLGVKRL